MILLEEWWLIVGVSLKASNVGQCPTYHLMLCLVDQSYSLSLILVELLFFEQKHHSLYLEMFLGMFRIYPPGN